MQLKLYILAALIINLGCKMENEKLLNDILVKDIFTTIKSKSLDLNYDKGKESIKFSRCTTKIYLFDSIKLVGDFDRDKKYLTLNNYPVASWLDRNVVYVNHYINEDQEKFLSSENTNECYLVIHEIKKISKQNFQINFVTFSGPADYRSGEFILSCQSDKCGLKSYKNRSSY